MAHRRPLFKSQNPMASAGGKRVNKAVSSEDTNVFTGEFALNNPMGTYWTDHEQDAELELSAGADAEVGGIDYVKITANGDGITVPGAWKNQGTVEIDETDTAVNHIYVNKTMSEITYVVKVE